ncbi:MAG: LptF/LptG family permease [Flammeovirgaceae bacterium]|nr:LptF/LptG family permease [Flammeovirgaceae bacterium]
MKKLDKLILSSFLGPFIITFLVVVFILLTQHMLKYFDDIIGKDLGWSVLSQLLFYFGIFMTPVAMPLSVLLASLITFGNLGEHFELTAIKSSGISLVRALQPIFFFVILLTGIAFYVNNNLVPKAALEAYSLMWDIKQQKPSLDLREGAFYNGIPDISIKVNKKYADGESLKDVVIYDHRKHDGNKDVTVADSGRMYTILNDRYLTLELYNGYNYQESGSREVTGRSKSGTSTLARSKFARTQVVFDLSSFQLSRTDKKFFQGNRIMRNLSQLDEDIDSVRKQLESQQVSFYAKSFSFFDFYGLTDSLSLPGSLHLSNAERDSIMKIYRPTYSQPEPEQQITTIKPDKVTQDIVEKEKPSRIRRKPMVSKSRIIQPPANKKVVLTDSAITAKIDSLININPTQDVYASAAGRARENKNQLSANTTTIDTYNTELRVFRIQWHKIISNSLACIAMFLIGAPLGSIIKRGGLGVPFLVSILFFIIFYLLTMQGEKWAKEGIISVELGVWLADLVLLIIGISFLRQARRDARLFESDYYFVLWDKLVKRFEPKST